MKNKLLLLLLVSVLNVLFGADSTNVNKKKAIGFEISPVWLIMSNKNDINIKGSFSSFNISPKLEFAIPFEIINRKDVEMDWYEEEIVKYRRYTIDFQPRFFLNKTQTGFYFSSGLRYTYENGIDTDLYWDTDEIKYFKQNKFGISFGIGYRYFSRGGLYWGISLYGGKYFTDNDIMIDGLSGFAFNPDLFFMMEILKFGYAF